MSRNRRRKPSSRSSAPPRRAAETAAGATPAEPAARREFPHPGPIDEPVRIALSAAAREAMTAHARESLDAEVCGVLVGELCEDAEGTWVSARAAVRGTSTRRGGTHVTYTQETWRQIHETIDRDYPDLKIVGWYHSHPGFGVTFSDMDRFIQENFFSAPGQFALVMDPIGGEEAVCVNGSAGIVHVGRIWVDGRPLACRLPARDDEEEATEASGPRGADAPAAATGAVVRRLDALEQRLQQVLQALDEERSSRHTIRLAVGMLAAVALLIWIGFTLLEGLWAPPRPPERVHWFEVPVSIEGEEAILGVEIVKWQLPERLQEAYRQAIIEQFVEGVRRRQEAEREAAEAEAAEPPRAPPQENPP